ncbi:GNAT family N-acetyltransferase [Psychrobacillus sp. AK 1817]|uniref:GNAT family N-acetyltransferase n=1 Tax=Psychrobacillus faecigallinarum TaxID=2762235 RepID=A0ABR8RDF1_9BACI|nr:MULTISPECIES: GNAT family N-acetyltransferase [Psychrobacillus]MBD7945786.1 GNAT family N-acetyltransferase [Psychrobacillus faecigallinarum]QEY22489.1 GNAT family N-acetyltransferase [Psychrobacillus sp. AK 1817]
MITQATKEEVEYILSHAVSSTYDATQIEISEEKAVAMLQGVLDKGGFYLIAKEEDGTITGWILLGKNTDYFTDQTYGFIYEIYVLPEHRGKGLSKLLINEGNAYWKSQGFDEVRLNVFASNFAKEIYRKMGFEEVNFIMKAKL